MRAIGSVSAVALCCLAVAGSAHAERRSEERPVGAFSTLRVENGIDVHLTQGDRERLRVEVDGVDLADVTTEVRDGELRISRTRSGGLFSFGDRDVDVYVDFVRLSRIHASGGSDVEGANEWRLDDLSIAASGGSDVEIAVQAKRLEASLSGGSDLDLRGGAESFELAASGGSDVSAEAFRAARASVQVSGGSDVGVHAREAVEIQASGGSDVSIAGNPAQRTVNNDRSSDVAWR